MIRDDDGSVNAHPETFDDIPGKHRHHGAGIDDRFDRRTTNIGFPAISPFEERPVSGILQLDVNDNLVHFRIFRDFLNEAPSWHGRKKVGEHVEPLHEYRQPAGGVRGARIGGDEDA